MSPFPGPGELDGSFEAEDLSTSKGTGKSGDDSSKKSSGSLASALASRETAQLKKLRLIFGAILFAAAGGVGFAIAWTTHQHEVGLFEHKAEDRSLKIMDTFRTSAEKKLLAIESLSISLTSYANFQNKTWPGVTMPDFALKAASIRSLSESAALAVYPRVEEEELALWEAYSVNNSGQVQDGLDFESRHRTYISEQRRLDEQDDDDDELLITPYVFLFEDGEKVPVHTEGPFFPLWQAYPTSPHLVNFDADHNSLFKDGMDEVLKEGHAVIGKTIDLSQDLDVNSFEEFKEYWESSSSYSELRSDEPIGKIFFPVFQDLDHLDADHIVALISAILFYESYMFEVLPPDAGRMYVVIENDCDQVFTYEVVGEEAHFIGNGDLHEKGFDHLMRDEYLFDHLEDDASRLGIILDDICHHHLRVYPSNEMKDEYVSNRPWFFLALVLGIFMFGAFVVWCYDRQVQKRQEMVMEEVQKAGAIVSSIFPEAVQRRMLADQDDSKSSNPFKQAAPSGIDAQKTRIKSFLDNSAADPLPGEVVPTAGDGGENEQETPGVPNKVELSIKKATFAETYPEVTICFMDITGFSSWSSQREPGEIFTLLQTLYHDFDMIGKEMKVFKVETIGDCYVAATGLPNAQPDHAVRITRFASKCMMAMIELTREMEVTLGPDTGDLRLRVGLHSGEVTAGVLQGAKARFQLFGDAMNMAARMEHNGARNRIQCSEDTASRLRAAGKEHWVRPRQDLVNAKGKGEVQTYWVLPRTGAQSALSSDHGEEEATTKNEWEDNVFNMSQPNSRYQRLIDWNVELLSGFLKEIQAMRVETRKTGRRNCVESQPQMDLRSGSTARDEITEVIKLPEFDARAHQNKIDPRSIVLDPAVISQLRDYVTTIASMYHSNPFHNFEHASHVGMSVNKLLKRVLVRDAEGGEISPEELHKYTFGITSDPLTQFSLIFCALIHDVDHSGVSNFQLINEGHTLAKLYKGKSVAEQNSVDLAWDLLQDPIYTDLQKAIYSDQVEMNRFRNLVVNIVLATDIFDRDMKSIRDTRWDKAFQYANVESEEVTEEIHTKLEVKRPDVSDEANNTNLKATIVMEHLIQASDVAHTMQHFDIYLKWNERLFHEMSAAYMAGRAPRDPAETWYEGEIMFFDKYIIPLAQKLDECGVFGVSSDEYLNYANMNRKLWAIKGDELVDKFIANREKNARQED